jgi:outer membrane protein assembly factor BamB
VQLDTGVEKWRFPAQVDQLLQFYAPPVLNDNGQLLVGSYHKSLFALDSASGVQVWVFPDAKSKFIASPLVTPDAVYAPSGDEVLYALDGDGRLLWSFPTPGGSQWSTPVTDANCSCIYLATMDHTIYAIDPADGSQLWRSEKFNGSIVGKPALSPEGVLFAGTVGKELVAYDTANRAILWRFGSEGWIWGGPLYIDGVVYFGDLSGKFFAIDVATGQKKWELPVDGPVVETAAFDGESLYLTTETGTLYALNLSGTLRWSKPLGGKTHTAPVLAGDLILTSTVATDVPLMTAFDKQGNQRWAFTPENK